LVEKEKIQIFKVNLLLGLIFFTYLEVFYNVLLDLYQFVFVELTILPTAFPPYP